MRIIKLTRGYEAIIDDDDFNRVSGLSWFAKIGGNKGEPYAAHTIRQGKRFKTIRLHRFLMNCPEGLEVHHLDKDPMNNQKSNLLIVSKGEHYEYKKT
jgi:hypothetical protein